ncbi:MAG: hypothetical protein COW16_10525 [Sphingomonadales bacterium CG12_big_fil_rev_8_21_14_0_65_65_10]|nr:MAG: hypothetical protein COW16_10525 [Sphingomonadales bacterium CG12_big_fil_rev_8_21_14_0_65_65_10]
MNDPAKQPIDIDAERRWLLEHKEAGGLSWSAIAKRINIPPGTISSFGGGNYKGNLENIANTIFKYRQLLQTQAQITTEVPEVPGYFETPTSKELEVLLKWAQRGRIVVAALGPGLGKTSTAREFVECYPNVALATMSPSTAGVNNMQLEVLAALGDGDAVGTPQKLSRRIRDRVRDLGNPVLIIDEAQHLSEKSVEEIRSWHDAERVGIALFGNIQVMQRLEGGSRKAAYAQLFSRIGLKLVRELPLEGDCDALAAAWNIAGPREIEFIRKIGRMPGGLRGATMTLEIATMVAQSDDEPLSVQHLTDAWAQLSSRRAAA